MASKHELGPGAGGSLQRLTSANPSAVQPFRACAPRLATCLSMKSVTVAVWLNTAAYIKLVMPLLSAASTLAPCLSTSVVTAAVWPFLAAHIKLVMPLLFAASTIASALTSLATSSESPLLAAPNKASLIDTTAHQQF